MTDEAFGPASENSWSARYKRNLARLRTGQPGQIAEVIGDLLRQEAVRGLTQGEKRMLAKARQMLA